MDQTKHHIISSEILSFPQKSQIDEQLLATVLDNMPQGVLMLNWKHD